MNSIDSKNEILRRQSVHTVTTRILTYGLSHQCALAAIYGAGKRFRLAIGWAMDAS